MNTLLTEKQSIIERLQEKEDDLTNYDYQDQEWNDLNDRLWEIKNESDDSTWGIK